MNFRSIGWKFGLFYLAMTLGALLLERSVALLVEFHRLEGDLRSGWLEASTKKAAALLETGSGRGLPPEDFIRAVLEAHLASLPLGEERSHDLRILLELPDPMGATVTAVDGTRSIRVNAMRARSASRAERAPGAPAAGDGPPAENVHRYEVPLHDSRGDVVGHLALDLPLPSHAWQVLFAESLEWLDLVEYMAVYVVASCVLVAIYLNRRLGEIETVAARWEKGDLSASIKEASDDELGRLARHLNRFTGLMHRRANEAVSNERQRLARGLHDTIKQRVLALNLQLAAAVRQSAGASGELSACLREARDLTREIQRQLATVTEGRVAASWPESFVNELCRRATDWSRRGSIRLRSRIQDVPDLSGEQYECLLAIVDEAFSNALRHSRASSIGLYLGRGSKHEFALIIADNGIGSGWSGEGTGMRNMRARAAQLPEGRFDVDSARGGGTAVTVTLRAQKALVREVA